MGEAAQLLKCKAPTDADDDADNDEQRRLLSALASTAGLLPPLNTHTLSHSHRVVQFNRYLLYNRSLSFVFVLATRRFVPFVVRVAAPIASRAIIALCPSCAIVAKASCLPCCLCLLFWGGSNKKRAHSVALPHTPSEASDLFVLSASPTTALSLSLYLALSLLLSLSGLTHPMAAMFIYKKFTVIYEHSHKESFGLGK